MAKPLTITLPPRLELWDGCKVRVTALNPTTGAVVTALQISNVTLEVDVIEGNAEDLAVGPFMLVTGPGG